MKKVLILKGIPASGKSTYARKLLEDKNQNWIRVNKDDARTQYFNGTWTLAREGFIVHMRNVVIRHAITEGYNIVVDDMNLELKHEERIRKIVDSMNELGSKIDGYDQYLVEIKKFDVDVETAIMRDAERENSVGQKVIADMYNKYIKDTL